MTDRELLEKEFERACLDKVRHYCYMNQCTEYNLADVLGSVPDPNDEHGLALHQKYLAARDAIGPESARILETRYATELEEGRNQARSLTPKEARIEGWRVVMRSALAAFSDPDWLAKIGLGGGVSGRAT
jgi:hypothetical protein